MNLKKLTPDKVRSRLVRKGLFTQMPVVHKESEGHLRLFRTVIDDALFDATSDNNEARKEAFKWFNPHTEYARDFEVICSNAGLSPQKTRTMAITFIENFFPQILIQTSCSFTLEDI